MFAGLVLLLLLVVKFGTIGLCGEIIGVLRLFWFAISLPGFSLTCNPTDLVILRGITVFFTAFWPFSSPINFLFTISRSLHCLFSCWRSFLRLSMVFSCFLIVWCSSPSELLSMRLSQIFWMQNCSKSDLESLLVSFRHCINLANEVRVFKFAPTTGGSTVVLKVLICESASDDAWTSTDSLSFLGVPSSSSDKGVLLLRDAFRFSTKTLELKFMFLELAKLKYRYYQTNLRKMYHKYNLYTFRE